MEIWNILWCNLEKIINFFHVILTIVVLYMRVKWIKQISFVSLILTLSFTIIVIAKKCRNTWIN